MYCPDCGHRNEQGARFCSNCARALPGTAPALRSRSLRERLEALIGTTRRARLLSAGTALAVAIAVLAFIRLEPGDDVPRDQYALDAEAICVEAKTQITAAGDGSRGNLGRYGSQIVPLATEWLAQFKQLQTPDDRAALAAALDEALVDVIIQAGTLARVGREAPPEAVVAQAGRVDAASAGVEKSIEDLRLDRCADLKIGPGSSG